MPKPDAAASSEYRIFETEEFQQGLERLPARERGFIRRKLDAYVYPQLRRNPFLGPNIRKLRGYSPDTWRYRVGRFRLFFLVNAPERIVYLVSADDRRDAYR